MAKFHSYQLLSSFQISSNFPDLQRIDGRSPASKFPWFVDLLRFRCLFSPWRGLLLASNGAIFPSSPYLTLYHSFAYSAITCSSLQGLEWLCSGQAIPENLIAMLRGRKSKAGSLTRFVAVRSWYGGAKASRICFKKGEAHAFTLGLSVSNDAF